MASNPYIELAAKRNWFNETTERKKKKLRENALVFLIFFPIFLILFFQSICFFVVVAVASDSNFPILICSVQFMLIFLFMQPKYSFNSISHTHTNTNTYRYTFVTFNLIAFVKFYINFYKFFPIHLNCLIMDLVFPLQKILL